MKQCPFCLGQVPDAAVKCQHCGEWLDGRGARTTGGPPSPDPELGRAANRYVSYQIVMSIVGLIVMLFFFLAFLSHRESAFPSFGPPAGFPISPR